ILDADLDDVDNVRVTALGAAEHLDAHQLAAATVVRCGQSGLHLDRVAISSIRQPPTRELTSTTRPFLVVDIGPHSATRTTSPSWQPCSSCACSLVERRMNLPYRPCLI